MLRVILDRAGAPSVQFASWLGVWGVLLFWKLGDPSFWDPDEAFYAETSREMLAAGNWLVPLYNGRPLFDKPILFHLLQMAAFGALGPTEFAARLGPALAAVGLVLTTAWLGRTLFDASTGRLAALVLATVSPMFALARYAILDMVFTMFLFAGVSLVAVAAMRDRPALQYPGYGLLALAVLTKGPVALALAGLAFGVSVLLSGEARRRLAGLHWIAGLAGIVAVTAPWFLWMWHRFGQAFVDGYILHGNVWLFSKSLYRKQPSYFFYLRVLAAGLLPWTPILLGYLVDVGRRLAKHQRPATVEILLWAWVLAIAGFFTASRFKLDRYIFPAAPALSLLIAHAWQKTRSADSLRPHLATVIGIGAIGPVLMILGVAAMVLAGRVPFDLPQTALILPLALIGGGAAFSVEMLRRRGRPPELPHAVIATLVAAYATVQLVGLPAMERAKPMREIARWMAATAKPEDRVASYRLTRWTPSWRFYVDRPAAFLYEPEELVALLAKPGRVYCVMLENEYEQLRARGVSLRIVYQREGLFTTTGRRLHQPRRSPLRRFVVVTNTG